MVFFQLSSVQLAPRYKNTTAFPSVAFFMAGVFAISLIQGPHHGAQKSIYTALPLYGAINFSHTSLPIVPAPFSKRLSTGSEPFNFFSKVVYRLFNSSLIMSLLM